MKVTLIKVSMLEGKGADAMKPLIFSIFDAVTPEDVTVEYLDERIEVLPEALDSDVIALSVETFAARRAYALAKKYKTPSNRIVMGGFHPTALPEEALEHCDTVLIGDAEDTWPAYLKDWKAGKEKDRYVSSHDAPMIPLNFNCKAYEGKKYNPIGLVQFSRGCKFRCDFCSIHSFYQCKVRQKAIDTVVEEIRGIQEKLLFFIDDNLFYDEASALALFQAIKPLKKKWACQISMDVANNDRLLFAMKESGCILVLIGFESLNPENLKQMKKSANLQMENYEKAIQNLYRHGLMIYATFVLGYGADTPETARETLDFALRNNFAAANFNPLIPLPGTELYARLEQSGKLIYPKWWLQEGFQYGDSAFFPDAMRPEDLKECCKSVRFAFNTYKAIFRRLWKNPVHRKPFNAAVFLALNLISRKEIHRKQGKELGGQA